MKGILQLSFQTRGGVSRSNQSTSENETRGVTMERRRDSLSQFEIDVAWCVERGGAQSVGDPSDRVASRVSQTPGVSIENHRGEAEAVKVASVGCDVERPFELHSKIAPSLLCPFKHPQAQGAQETIPSIRIGSVFLSLVLFPQTAVPRPSQRAHHHDASIAQLRLPPE